MMAENKPHVHHKTHLHTMKVYNTRPVKVTIKPLTQTFLGVRYAFLPH